MNIHSLPIHKYPSTPHVQGSGLQKGDKANEQVPLKTIAGRWAVIEEKLDGANSGWSYSPAAELLLQSRGHYLVGGGRERQFNLLKPWAECHADTLLERLEDRYVMYGEWMYTKHSVFYDRLPHYFNEFDILDRKTGAFLSTPRRREMLAGTPIVQVPVVYEGPLPSDMKLLWKLVYRSLAKSRNWKQAFERQVARERLDLELSWAQTNQADLSEGLYIKIEEDGRVVERYKVVRADFVQTILDADSHHEDRPVLPNLLAPGVDIYAPQPTVTWEDLGLRTLRGLDELKAASRQYLECNRPGDPDEA